MYIQDLQPLTKSPAHTRELAVGWLEHGLPFPTGQVSSDVVEKLHALRVNAWAPASSLGIHICSLCAPDHDEETRTQFAAGAPGLRCDVAAGSYDLYLPGEGCVYVAPELIIHYIVDHGYAPPEVFCAAVLRCPAMNSLAYFAALERALPVLLDAPGGLPGQAARSIYAQQQERLAQRSSEASDRPL